MFNMSFQQIIFKISETFYFLFFSTESSAPECVLYFMQPLSSDWPGLQCSPRPLCDWWLLSARPERLRAGAVQSSLQTPLSSLVWLGLRPATQLCHLEATFAYLLEWIPSSCISGLSLTSLWSLWSQLVQGHVGTSVSGSFCFNLACVPPRPAHGCYPWELLPPQFLSKFPSSLLLCQIFFSS